MLVGAVILLSPLVLQRIIMAEWSFYLQVVCPESTDIIGINNALNEAARVGDLNAVKVGNGLEGIQCCLNVWQ